MSDSGHSFKQMFKRRLYAWVLRLVRFTDKLPKDLSSSIISKQLVRSGTSVLANYVEAGSASSKKEFILFFNHSLKSANESKMWLTLLRDSKKGNPREINALLIEMTEISKVLASSIITLRKQ